MYIAHGPTLTSCAQVTNAALTAAHVLPHSLHRRRAVTSRSTTARRSSLSTSLAGSQKLYIAQVPTSRVLVTHAVRTTQLVPQHLSRKQRAVGPRWQIVRLSCQKIPLVPLASLCSAPALQINALGISAALMGAHA